MKRKAERIKNDIVLSVKYARLREEADDTEAKRRSLAEKKKLLGSNDKQIEKSDRFIGEVKDAINKIKKNNPPNTYLLVENGKAEESLKRLSKYKDFELIKYQMAIEIVMDDYFAYTDNTNVDFLEKISLMIFDDKKTIRDMSDEYKRIKTRIHGESVKSPLESPIKAISVGVLVKNFITSPKKALIVAGVAGGGVVLSYFKRRKQAKAQSSLALGDFANTLVISAMNLLYAKKAFTTETGYRNYFKSVLKEINLDRKFIMKKMFEEQYEIGENAVKIKLLHNFDDYLIEQMNKNGKKRGK